MRPSLAGQAVRQAVAREFTYMPLRCVVCGGPAFDCACVRASLSAGLVHPAGGSSIAPVESVRMNRKIVSGLAGVAALAAGTAHAALDAAVTTAVSTTQADGVTLVGLLAAAGAAVFLISKLLRKFGIFF